MSDQLDMLKYNKHSEVYLADKVVDFHMDYRSLPPIMPVEKIKNLGQVFTPESVVEFMLSLRENNGSILEPSCGDGSFLSKLEPDAIGLELDASLIQDSRVIYGDFFGYKGTNSFETIIGNPPYVRFQDIKTSTKRLLNVNTFDKRSNLYLFFIDKCVDLLADSGELIFITPRDFIKATSARHLNRRLYQQGSFTHFYELGDQPIFNGASPNCVIWRWVKGRKERSLLHRDGESFQYKNGQIWFGSTKASTVSDYFDVKVGAVSGADRCFSHNDGIEFVHSKTISTGQTKRMIFNECHSHLLQYKDCLISRRIRHFDESNWWQWGRNYCRRQGARIYVNCKTRNKNPFFVSEVEAYDGSVMAMFPKSDIDLEKAAYLLNEINWDSLGFVCDGRKIFTQRSLANAVVSL